nr:hypothetical protein [Tanacetum cinerariifolium]
MGGSSFALGPGPTNGATDYANMDTIRLRWGSNSLRLNAGLPRLMYHDLYLGEKALVERENVGFDLTKSDLFPSFIEDLTAKGVGLHVADSHTGNHREDVFTPLETICRFLGIIRSRSLSGSKGGLRARWEVLPGGKNCTWKRMAGSSQVEMDPAGVGSGLQTYVRGMRMHIRFALSGWCRIAGGTHSLLQEA